MRNIIMQVLDTKASESAQLMLAKEAWIQGLPLLFSAVYKGELKPVQNLVTSNENRARKRYYHYKDSYSRSGEHIRTYTLSILLLAAAEGHVKIVRWLLDTERAKIEEKDGNRKTALLFAAREGRLEVVECLLTEYKANVNEKCVDGRTALWYAVCRGDLRLMVLLLTIGKADDLDKTTVNVAWFLAAQNGRLEIMQWLLEAGLAQLSKKDELGHTALLIATAYTHLHIIEWLVLKKNVPIDERNDNDVTALLIAAYNGYASLVRWLVKAGGASVEAKNKDGMTALLLAASQGNIPLVQWLLTEGKADIRDRNCEGTTVLLFLAGHRDLASINMIQEMLQKDRASIHERDNYRHTIVDIAINARNIALLQMLITEFGIDPKPLIENHIFSDEEANIARTRHHYYVIKTEQEDIHRLALVYRLAGLIAPPILQAIIFEYSKPVYIFENVKKLEADIRDIYKEYDVFLVPLRNYKNIPVKFCYGDTDWIQLANTLWASLDSQSMFISRRYINQTVCRFIEKHPIIEDYLLCFLNLIIEETAYLGRPTKAGLALTQHLLTCPRENMIGMISIGDARIPATKQAQPLSTTSATQSQSVSRATLFQAPDAKASSARHSAASRGRCVML